MDDARLRASKLQSAECHHKANAKHGTEHYTRKVNICICISWMPPWGRWHTCVTVTVTVYTGHQVECKYICFCISGHYTQSKHGQRHLAHTACVFVFLPMFPKSSACKLQYNLYAEALVFGWRRLDNSCQKPFYIQVAALKTTNCVCFVWQSKVFKFITDIPLPDCRYHVS